MATTSAADAPVVTTDFQRDLNRLDGEIARLSGEATGESAGATVSRHDTLRLVSLQYRRATLLGSWNELRLVGGSLGALVGRLGPLPDLCLLQGLLDLTMHRLGEV